MRPRVRSDVGDGDLCPLFPAHGFMLTVSVSDPPKQYCPHVEHDGGPGTVGAPRSRSIWPLYGFEESVKTYMARLDRAIREAGGVSSLLIPSK